MKFKTIIILVLMLALPVILLAQHGSHGKGWYDAGSKGSHFGKAKSHFKAARGEYWQQREHFGQGRKMHEMLDLTDEQEAQIDKMAEEFQLAQIDRKAELKKAQLKLKNLAHDDQASEREVFRLIDDVSGLKAELHKARYSHRREFQAILTEEQAEKLKEMRRGGGRHNFDVECFFEGDDDDGKGHEMRQFKERKKVIDHGGY